MIVLFFTFRSMTHSFFNFKWQLQNYVLPLYNNSTGMISLQYYVGFYCENTQIILIIFQNKTYTFKLCLFYLIFATYIRTT